MSSSPSKAMDTIHPRLRALAKLALDGEDSFLDHPSGFRLARNKNTEGCTPAQECQKSQDQSSKTRSQPKSPLSSPQLRPGHDDTATSKSNIGVSEHSAVEEDPRETNRRMEWQQAISTLEKVLEAHKG
ncbi:hypothetical protein FALBO_11504 [Fusarium albosuccineum]|uniref:Uncharacterized protein n=1 Tax=Fusarium albosuccineum TaxID=1237068 RepID=A0A8H4PHT2_9HYPO|nr:hypothetical protein FALBO_11504 [Fusarium albosuccineum]